MKIWFRTLGVVALLASASPLAFSTAHAGNSAVETTLQSFGDLSVFYQAMLNSGALNELSENQHYTIFAPTNAAFAQIQQSNYPCFYSTQCRPQIAALLRNHIIPGKHDAANLVTYGQGIQTIGNSTVTIREPFVNDFTVENRTLLSKSESGGNVIYRIDGVLADPESLAQFHTVRYAPPIVVPSSTVTTQRVMTTYDPSAIALQPYPAGSMVPPTSGMPDQATETTTVISGYTATGEVVQ